MHLLTMYPLKKSDLLSLEQYHSQRSAYRASVMEHKKHRRVALGPNATLYFEDKLTMQYQIQEVLRIEKIFDGAAIEEELDAYNPLIPTGRNWKATFMIEYEDAIERKEALQQLIGIERQIWIQIGDLEKIEPIANEDLVRETEEKTSAIHFLRFELTNEMIEAVVIGTDIKIGVDHPAYRHETGALPKKVANALASDLDDLDQ